MKYPLPAFQLPSNYQAIVKNDMIPVDHLEKYYYQILESLRNVVPPVSPVSAVFLYRHNKIAQPNEIIEAMRKLNLRPATATENVALSILYPQFRRMHAVAWGNKKDHSDGCCNIPAVDCYRKWGCQALGFHLWSNSDGWDTFWHFTGVPII